jgi:hypothetical protein
MGQWMYRSTLSWPRRAPSIHRIGGWVGPRAGLDGMEKWKFLTLPGLELRPLDHAARIQSLCRLSYRGTWFEFRPGHTDYPARVSLFCNYLKSNLGILLQIRQRPLTLVGEGVPINLLPPPLNSLKSQLKIGRKFNKHYYQNLKDLKLNTPS